MAQTEDTELRDLVVDALEKNGSLPKIRAALRANIFLAFEDEFENNKQESGLDSVLKSPEGLVSLALVHEFLEFCDLKNTLFVYKSESRQGNEYNYEGQKLLASKLNLSVNTLKQEPLLVSILKLLNNHNKFSQGDTRDTPHKKFEAHDKVDQNGTYIVHDNSTGNSSSNSNSETSSDEKNKLHLRLQLDNSDTDTSCDSAKDKTSSEYIPNAHILQLNDTKNNFFFLQKHSNYINSQQRHINVDLLQQEHKTPITSESTSYVDLKPCDVLDGNFNANVVQSSSTNLELVVSQDQKTSLKEDHDKAIIESDHSATLSSVHSSIMNEKKEVKSPRTNLKDSPLSGKTQSDYSNDFTSSSSHKEVPDIEVVSPEKVQDKENNLEENVSIVNSPHQISQSSGSSVSISDITDLLSEQSLSGNKLSDHKHLSDKVVASKISTPVKSPKSDDSGDFSESPIPSISNLSLDIHSD